MIQEVQKKYKLMKGILNVCVVHVHVLSLEKKKKKKKKK
eukprot:CAMPEP_0201493742 /NCGR_PEP_ID=MMETSP0151_2-20130828/41294_1 /ASSEMBLY_ACC=CAM_ASM_000257 /TAXON_ID=200890 /ORGANISM="Paramoeba atlantica, Strain 621/1 / CCAP 1560/9" /LENGTH=38 /DNA_ID= /DNA_START= /DNA_END= /DNA_ORIENTATION=